MCVILLDSLGDYRLLFPHVLGSLFEQVPRKKYVDIVTDTLHASSSDLITWNTLAMIRTELQGHIPQTWLEITAASLSTWEQRDRQETFLTMAEGMLVVRQFA